MRPSRMRTIRAAADATLGVVGHEENRLPARVEPAQELDDLLAALGVQCPGGLVRQQQRGLVGQRAGDGESLPLTTREHAGHGPRLVADAEEVEKVARPALCHLALPAGDHGRQRDVLQHRHPFQEIEELEDDADVTAAHLRELVFGPPRDELAGHGDRAFVGDVQSGDQVEQGRLPATGRAHQGDEVSRRHHQIGSPEGSYRSVLRLEGLADLVYDQGIHVRFLLSSRHRLGVRLSTSLYAMTGVSRPFTS